MCTNTLKICYRLNGPNEYCLLKFSIYGDSWTLWLILLVLLSEESNLKFKGYNLDSTLEYVLDNFSCISLASSD